jgi:hypothetical protein
MAKKNRIVATYRLGADEFLQVSIEADNAYPEALAVARANARELMADLLADVMGNTVADAPVPDAPMPDGDEAT